VFPNPLTALLDRLIVCDNNDCMSTLWFPPTPPHHPHGVALAPSARFLPSGGRGAF